MKALHGRRSIRLRGYDYSRQGAYFVTICCHGRRCLLGTIKGGMVVPTPVGQAVLTCWEAIPRHAPRVDLDAYVLMPNHLHGIIYLTDEGRGTPWRAPTDSVREAFGQPRSGSLATVVRSFKTASTRAALEVDLHLGSRLWQRGYYEHVDTRRRRSRTYPSLHRTKPGPMGGGRILRGRGVGERRPGGRC